MTPHERGFDVLAVSLDERSGNTGTLFNLRKFPAVICGATAEESGRTSAGANTESMI
jgi:hypothetical protein